MRLNPTILAALLALSSATLAQTPPTPARQAAPARPPAIARPAEPARPPREERAPTEQEELALAALEGLMAQPGDRALPIIKRVLAGSQTTLVKQRALFVLSQINAPEARQILAQTARSPDSALRGDAIRSIGISGDTQALESLKEIYKTGGDEAQEQVLQAWLIAGRKDLVYEAALNAKTEEEVNRAIRMLGVMGASEELRKLGDKPNASSGLVQAYAISGDLASLRKIAEGNGDQSVRVEAVRNIGIIQDEAARIALREIYARATNPEIKEAAMQGMLIAQDEQGVMAAYRSAKTPDEKRSLLRYLSMMDGDAALQAIDAALEEKK